MADTSSTPGPVLRHRHSKEASPAATSRKKMARSHSEGEDSVDSMDDESELEGMAQQSIAKANPKEPVSLQKVMTRSIAAIVMMSTFSAVIYAGHFFCIVLCVLIETELYRELVNVRYVHAKDKKMPWFRSLQWLWFGAAMFSMYGEAMHKFCLENRSLQPMTVFTKQHDVVGYASYCVMFVITVLSLRPGLLRYQISHVMWSIVIIVLIIFQSKFACTNVLRGLFWLFFPVATVITNDVTAYFCGITLGRKIINAPFLSLSPNKTWEGFIGAAFFTIIFSFLAPYYMAQYQWIICPADGLYFTPFPPPLQCVPHAVFTDHVTIALPIVGEMDVLPIQLHGLVFGLFASLVASFGGFFASAVKRAYKLKDFDSIVPGHGGFMDRMDCQLLIIAFASFYYSNYIVPEPSLARMEFLVSMMKPEDQVKLLETVRFSSSCLCFICFMSGLSFS
jgi:phosphatidate cytidylyltransferase